MDKQLKKLQYGTNSEQTSFLCNNQFKKSLKLKSRTKQQLHIQDKIRKLCKIQQIINIQMFEQSRQEDVIVKFKLKPDQKQEQIKLSITLNEDDEIYIPDLLRKIKDIVNFDDSSILFYYDTLKGAYFNLQEEWSFFIPFSVLVTESFISLQLQSRSMSDQLLANPPIKSESMRSKRSPQRIITEVFDFVALWRNFYTQGVLNQKGQYEKVTLQRAALLTGVPRKSLQDYYLLLRNGYHLGFDFKENARKKVGVLRNFVKQKKKIKIEQSQQKQRIKSEQKYEQIILAQIRKQIIGMTEKQYQQEIFKVVNNGSSDQDQIGIKFDFQN